MSDGRIVFDRVSMRFSRGEIHDSLRDLIPALVRQLAGRGKTSSQLDADDFWAVNDLSFQVAPGEVLGIIGANGSGKSTTLRILTKILEPTRGRCDVRGRIGALIEVSAGFHGDLTGRENVFLQGAIMGMRSRDIKAKFDEIVAFSGVSEFIDTPVKRYSSGMNARLGFSIAAHLDPDVLVIDEVLAVGDFLFQERAFGRIRELAASGIPVVIVSHQLDRVADLCTSAILLRRGEVACRGSAAECISAYVQPQGDIALSANGNARAPLEFTSLRIADGDTVVSGGWCTIDIHGTTLRTMSETIDPLALQVRSVATGRVVFMTGAKRLNARFPDGGPFHARVRLQLNVPPGAYMVEGTAYDAASHDTLVRTPVAMVHVTDPGTFAGTVQLNAEISVAGA